jgi:hypothetical protein
MSKAIHGKDGQISGRFLGLLRFARSLRRNERGSTLAMMAAGLFPIMASIGSAIDIARIYIATSQMQAGADAAALAGANAFDNSDDGDPNGRRQQVIAYFRDNYPDSYMGIRPAAGVAPIGNTTTLLEPKFETVSGVSQTVVTATGTLPMTFLSIFGIAPKRIEVTAHAEFQPHPLEVMVVLDNTGSMLDAIAGTPKITALKAAMHSFINVLYQGGSADQPNLAMGIINYTNQVNVGSLLSTAGVATEAMPGFTDRNWQAGDGMGWKGCVANDETITSMADNTTVEAGAYDITNILPGEKPVPGSSQVMAPIKPLIMPPLWIPKTSGDSKTAANSAYWTVKDNTDNNNLYSGSSTDKTLATISDFANSPTFKRYFYRYYISLNNGSDASSMADDVIVSTDKSSYYDPSLSGAYNWATRTGTDFWVRADKLPNLASFRAAAPYVVSSNNTPMPSPNWQCPEPGLPITYNVSRATFDSYIDQRVWAIKPANGTMHHTGFLWGWRILSRYDKFVRTKPMGSASPARAMVFMTDGETALSSSNNANDKVYTAYGSVNDQTITTATDNTGAVANAANLRFKKACALANSYVFPDSRKTMQTYVVAINTSSGLDSASKTRLKNCGKDGYYLTATPTDLNNAFAQIARTLVDVHLTR